MRWGMPCIPCWAEHATSMSQVRTKVEVDGGIACISKNDSILLICSLTKSFGSSKENYNIILYENFFSLKPVEALFYRKLIFQFAFTHLPASEISQTELGDLFRLGFHLRFSHKATLQLSLTAERQIGEAECFSQNRTITH